MDAEEAKGHLRRARLNATLAKVGTEVPYGPGGHSFQAASSLIPGDGIHHAGRSWVVKDIRDHDRGRTVVMEPRAGHVGQNVVSRMQFGVEGLTMEDTSEQAYTFHPDALVARRD